LAAESGGSIYAGYIKDQLARQDERKVSIERRGINVITTSGVLVSLLFGLATVLTGADNYQLPSGTKPWIYGALLGFVLAAVGGILTNIPMFYSGVEVAGLKAATKLKMGDSADTAYVRVASTDVKLLATAQKLNNVKGWILLGAVVAQMAAVVSLALAVRVILAHG
jgi:hypothetical protein